MRFVFEGVSEKGRLDRLLGDRRSDVAEAWYQAIRRTGFTPFTASEARGRLRELTGRVIRLLLEEEPDGAGAREVGVELARLHYLSPDTLGGTRDALAEGLLAGLTDDQSAFLQPRLYTMLFEMAVGFHGEARERILSEQEEIRAALLSDRRRAEEALSRSEASLAEAQRIAGLGHWEYDFARDELRWSDEVYRIFGLNEREFVATLEAFQEAVHPEDRGTVRQTIEQAFSGEPVVLEHRIVRPDGEVRHVQERAEYVFAESEEPVGLVGTVQDITERKEAEKELERRALELARSNAELEQFAAVVAHDLRAPIRNTSGFARILLEDYAGRLDDEGRDYLRRILASSERMERLVDGLLDLSRVTRAKMNREQVDLSVLVRAIVENLEPGGGHPRGEFDIAKGLVAEGDPVLLRAVLENLLGNAWKFTRDEELPRIEFGAERRDGETLYFVRDNGIGFDPAYAEEVFGVFQQLHPAGAYEGLGMGLATVRRIIQRHGGRVWAESEEGRGATFYFTLQSGL